MKQHYGLKIRSLQQRSRIPKTFTDWLVSQDCLRQGRKLHCDPNNFPFKKQIPTWNYFQTERLQWPHLCELSCPQFLAQAKWDPGTSVSRFPTTSHVSQAPPGVQKEGLNHWTHTIKATLTRHELPAGRQGLSPCSIYWSSGVRGCPREIYTGPRGKQAKWRNKLSVASEVNNGATRDTGTGCGWGASPTLTWHHCVVFGRGQQWGQGPTCASWCFAVPGLDWEVSGRGKLALPSDHFPLDCRPPSSVFFHAASLPSNRKNMSYRGDGPVWTGWDCSCFGERADGHFRKRRSDSPVLTLTGTSFKIASDGVFPRKMETCVLLTG